MSTFTIGQFELTCGHLVQTAHVPGASVTRLYCSVHGSWFSVRGDLLPYDPNWKRGDVWDEKLVKVTSARIGGRT